MFIVSSAKSVTKNPQKVNPGGEKMNTRDVSRVVFSLIDKKGLKRNDLEEIRKEIGLEKEPFQEIINILIEKNAITLTYDTHTLAMLTVAECVRIN